MSVCVLRSYSIFRSYLLDTLKSSNAFQQPVGVERSILTSCSMYSVSQYHAKASTKINFSKKGEKKKDHRYSSAPRRGPGAC